MAWRPLVLIAALALLGPPGAPALAQAADSPGQPLVSRIIFAPKDVGAPRVTVSGGVRGISRLPSIAVLAPPILVPLASAQPTLYWFQSGPSDAPVRVTVTDEEQVQPAPLLEVTLGPYDRAGIYALSLAEHGVALDRPGRYGWSVALDLPAAAPSEQPVAATLLERVADSPAIAGQASSVPTLALAQVLAAAGYWYEPLDLVSRALSANDDSAPWRALRADLLAQVDLDAAAAYDRARLD
jgi:hypothetical protein